MSGVLKIAVKIMNLLSQTLLVVLEGPLSAGYCWQRHDVILQFNHHIFMHLAYMEIKCRQVEGVWGKVYSSIENLIVDVFFFFWRRFLYC